MKPSTPKCVVLYPPAKVNLYLEVLSRRPDGFHNIETIMTTVDLRDTLTARTSGNTTLTTEPPMNIPPEKNLVITAQRALEAYTSTKLPAAFHLVKRIPVGAGLGGGSSDAAAALRSLNILYGLSLSRRELASVAAKVGSDVPFFIYGGWALCRGRGEDVTHLRMGGRLSLVIISPGIPVPTGDVYQNMKSVLTENVKNVNLSSWLAAASDGEISNVALFNRLEAVALSLETSLEKIKRVLCALGSPSILTGSGSAFLVLADRKSVSKVKDTAWKHGWKAFATHTCAGT